MGASSVSSTAALFRLDGIVAIVTGAGAGIGRSIALMFAGAGAAVVAVDRDAESAANTVSLAEPAGGRVLALTADVALPADCQKIFDTTLSQFGRLDVLVNNAGIYPPFPRLPEIDWETFHRTFEINVHAALRCSCEAARHMKPGSRIINISSIESLRPSNPSTSHYGMSKATVNAMTRAAAVDLAPMGIRVNAILPGLVKTEGTRALPDATVAQFSQHAPSGRIGAPEDIAAAALFLASAASSYINGHCLVVDGGVTISG